MNNKKKKETTGGGEKIAERILFLFPRKTWAPRRTETLEKG